MSKVAIVTGGTSGIGQSIGTALTSDGFTTIRVSRSPKMPDKYRRACDVRDKYSIRDLIFGVMEDFGRIDVLVNSAGIASTTPLERLGIHEWNDIISTNLTGSFLMCRDVIPHMVAAGFGRIINIGSIAGIKRSEVASVAYTCSKYGITGLTKQLAPIYAKDGITINCLCPSQTMTEMYSENVSPEDGKKLSKANPMGRLAHPSDIAGVARFLATDAAAYINGETIAITGGIV